MSKRVIITGSKTIEGRKAVYGLLGKVNSKLNPAVVVTGGEKNGVDSLVDEWAEINDIKVEKFPIKWKDVDVEGAEVIEGPYGPYNKRAPLQRNRDMLKDVDFLFCIWDGEDIGNKILFEYAKNQGINVSVVILKDGGEPEKHTVEVDPKYAKKAPVDDGGEDDEDF